MRLPQAIAQIFSRVDEKTEMRDRDRSRKWLFAPLVALLSLFAALAVAELGLRLVGFEFALLPTKVQFGWPDARTLKSTYRVDEDLLWVPKNYDAILEHARSNRPDIVFMGCSVTEFSFYPAVFRERFEEAGRDRHLQTLSLGIAGWTSYQGVQQMRRDVAPLKPRFVTILYGWNDHWLTFGTEDKSIGQFNLDVPSWLLQLSELRVVQVVNRALFSIMKIRDEGSGPPPPRVTLSDFRANLREMVQIARANGITPILMTAPSSHLVGEEPAYLADGFLDDLSQLVPIHDAYAEAVREVAGVENVELVDLHAAIRALPQASWSRYLGEDGIHLTPRGSRRVGAILYEAFVARGLDRALLH